MKYLQLLNFTDSKNAIKIAALPMLCPPKGRIKCDQKAQWKPTILECQESIINLVSVSLFIYFLMLLAYN